MKITMNDLIRESRRWISINSVLFGSMSSTSICPPAASLDSCLENSSLTLLRLVLIFLNTTIFEEEVLDFFDLVLDYNDLVSSVSFFWFDL